MKKYFDYYVYILEHYNENSESVMDPDMIVIEMEKISVMFERQVFNLIDFIVR